MIDREKWLADFRDALLGVADIGVSKATLMTSATALPKLIFICPIVNDKGKAAAQRMVDLLLEYGVELAKGRLSKDEEDN